MMKKFKHMKIGEVIERLEGMPSHTIINGLGNLNIKYGCRQGVGFEYVIENSETVHSILFRCKRAFTEVFLDVNGNERIIDWSDPVWIDEFGSGREKLMSINSDGSLVTESEKK